MNRVPSNPNVSVNNGKYFIMIKQQDQSTVMQKEAPKFFNFCGIISEITKNGRLNTAQDAMNIINEKLAIGIQLTASRSTPDDLIII